MKYIVVLFANPHQELVVWSDRLLRLHCSIFRRSNARLAYVGFHLVISVAMISKRTADFPRRLISSVIGFFVSLSLLAPE